MSWYKAGTVSVTNGNAVVTGTGTAFVANVKVGDAFVGPDDRAYEIVTVNSNTSLTISPAYLGSNQSGQSYRIQPTNGITVDLTNSVQTLIGTYSGVLAGAGAGQFGDGNVSAPGIRFTNDQDTGFWRSAANRMAAVTGGVARMTWRENGDVGIGTASPAFTTGGGLEVERAGPATLRLDNAADGVRAELTASTSTVDLNMISGAPFHLRWGSTARAGFLWNQFWIDVSQVVRGSNRVIFGDVSIWNDHGPFIGYTSATDTLDIGSGAGLDSTGSGAGGIRFGVASSSSWTARLRLEDTSLRPEQNNLLDLGSGAARYKDLYLVNAPNVSSDERLKNWQRSTLTEGEIAAGERILNDLGFYQWLDMIAEKGVENARWHYGALAQEVVRIFIDEGVEAIDPALLDIEPDVFVAEEDRPSMRQAFLTFDTWEASYEDDVLVRPAGNVFGFRPEQLALFLLRVSHELRLRDKAAAELRMDALEQRIEALEGV